MRVLAEDAAQLQSLGLCLLSAAHAAICAHVRRTFLLNRERAVDYLNMLDRIYVFDGFAGWDPEVRWKQRAPSCAQ